MYFSRFLERFALLLIAAGLASHSALAVDITGAGATFPYPIYAKWAEAYKAKTGNNLNYQSIGSGGGIRQIQNKTVDFGASDMPLKPEELEKSGLVQFPTVVVGDVPVVNLPGIKPGEIRLTGPVLADIYLGKIKKWNDPVLTSLNPGVKLPDQDIMSAPFRWFRNDFYLGELLVQGQSGMEGKGRRGHLGELARGRGGQGQRGCCFLRSADRRRNRLCRIRLCIAEQVDP